MAFIRDEKHNSLIYDPVRKMQLARGPGAHGRHINYLCRDSGLRSYLGGGVVWNEWSKTVLLRTVSHDERFPDRNRVICSFVIEEPWTGRGPFELPGMDRKETIAIVKEALVAHLSIPMTNNAEKTYWVAKLSKNMEAFVNKN